MSNTEIKECQAYYFDFDNKGVPSEIKRCWLSGIKNDPPYDLWNPPVRYIHATKRDLNSGWYLYLVNPINYDGGIYYDDVIYRGGPFTSFATVYACADKKTLTEFRVAEITRRLDCCEQLCVTLNNILRK